MRILCTLLALALVPHVATAETDPYRALLTTDTIGAASFIKSNPTWDGRGIVVAVLDTGVDVSAPGLTETSTGKPKVILTRDFSGQGTLKLTEVKTTTEDERRILRTDGGFVFGHERPEHKDATYHLGWIDEASFKNAGVHDLNGNGDHTDRFAFLRIEQPGKDDTVLIDLDGNQDLRGEPLLGSYDKTLESFTFKGFDPKSAISPLAFTLYLGADPSETELHFDDGGHGSHVAGISTGFNVHGEEGFHGIAPGAEVMSLKIGNNALAGGATTTGAKEKALRFAAKWARDNDRIVVLNMSYGIGSEIEGYSDIDLLLTDVLRENPHHLFMSTSAGNSGPGLSTVGQPAASVLAFTAAAALTRENAAGLWGSRISRDQVFSFSSRGGELNKPDGLLPGVASSTVPPFLPYDVMAGTSMAAPQGAGAHAVLLSAAVAKGVLVNNGMLRRALRYSGKPLSGFTVLDQGGGMVHVPSAWRALRKIAKSKEAKEVLGYTIETPCVTCVGGQAAASYWRTGGYIPGKERPIQFSITPLFSGDMNAKDRDTFFQRYRLDTDTDWIDIRTDEVYIKGDETTQATLILDPSDVPKVPGYYVGTAQATAKGGPSSREGTAFELQVVLIVPERYREENGYSHHKKGLSLEPSEVDRFFLLVPPGASVLSLEVEVTSGDVGTLRFVPNDPNGRKVWLQNGTMDVGKGKNAHMELGGPELTPGIWELTAYASFRNTEKLRYNLKTAFRGIEAPDLSILVLPQGENASIEGVFTNRYNKAFSGNIRASLDGYGRDDSIDIEGDKAEYPFGVEAGTKEVVFRLRLEPEDYARFTDVAVTIHNSAGKAVVKGGFGQARTTVVLRNPSAGNYRLSIEGALTHESPESWSVQVDEHFKTGETIPITFTADGAKDFTLFPNVPQNLVGTLSKRPRLAPEGYEYRGELQLNHGKTKQRWLSLPLKITP